MFDIRLDEKEVVLFYINQLNCPYIFFIYSNRRAIVRLVVGFLCFNLNYQKANILVTVAINETISYFDCVSTYKVLKLDKDILLLFNYTYLLVSYFREVLVN